jgi:hypothetical protein
MEPTIPVGLRRLLPFTPWILGAGFFFFVAGFRILDPLNIAWLWDGDPATHYLGWEFYRNSEWSFPVGLNPRYGAELSSSIVYSDSLPLFAILFKPLASILPNPFQYFGLWVLLCFLLQAWLGWLLIGLFSQSAITKMLGTSLFVIAPAMLWNFHPGIGTLALGGHFLILGALYLCLRDKLGVAWTGWCLVLGVATLVHAYLLAMVLALWLADVADRLARREVRFPELARQGSILVATVGLIAWQAGYFMFGAGLDEWGYGFFRMNVLGPLDPSKHLSGSWSYLMPDIPGDRGSAEGFNFLGLGVILLFIAVIPMAIVKKTQVTLFPIRRPFFLSSLIALSAFAITNNVGVGPYSIEFPIPDEIKNLAAVFRASGRMFWPTLYALIFCGIKYVTKGTSRRVGQLLLGLALLVQISDTRQATANIKSALMIEPRSVWSTDLVNPFWTEIPNHYKSIKRIYPGGRHPRWKEISYLASGSGLSTDLVYLGRVSEAKIGSAIEVRRRSVETGNYDTETIYIINEIDARLLEQACETIYSETDSFTRIDGLSVLAPGWNKLGKPIPGNPICQDK